MSIKNISVFCGAHLGNNPIYASEAKKVAEVIVEKGMNVVFGGGDVGLMGVVSHTAIDNGGEVLGISLQSLYELELTNPRIQEVVVAQTLLERKDIFMQRSDAFIVLPGGVGSLDELAEVMCSNQLGIINKPIGILNTNGYYDHLLAWMKKATEGDNPPFWYLRRMSLIQADMGDKAGAIATAKKSLEGAIKAGNKDYEKMNQESI